MRVNVEAERENCSKRVTNLLLSQSFEKTNCLCFIVQKAEDELGDHIATVPGTNPLKFWEWDEFAEIPPWVNPRPGSFDVGVDTEAPTQPDGNAGAVDVGEEGNERRPRQSNPLLGRKPSKHFAIHQSIPPKLFKSLSTHTVINEPSQEGRACKVLSFDSITFGSSQSGPFFDYEGLRFYQGEVLSVDALKRIDQDMVDGKIIPSVAYGFHTSVISNPNALIPAPLDSNRAILIKGSSSGKLFDFNGVYGNLQVSTKHMVT